MLRMGVFGQRTAAAWMSLALVACSVDSATRPDRAPRALRRGVIGGVGVVGVLGAEAWWANDRDCLWSPDAMAIAIAYGYQEVDGTWVVTERRAAGHTAYWCNFDVNNPVYRGGDFSSSPAWMACAQAYSPGGTECPWNPGWDGTVLGVRGGSPPVFQ